MNLCVCSIISLCWGIFFNVPNRLWQHVTRAIMERDQVQATQEKFVLEEAQRREAKERGDKPWIPQLFQPDPITSEWIYRHMEYDHTYLGVLQIPKCWVRHLKLTEPLFAALGRGTLKFVWFSLRRTEWFRHTRRARDNPTASPTATAGPVSTRWNQNNTQFSHPVQFHL